MSENACRLCAVEKLTFEPPPIYCTACGARIKRNASYYTTGSGDTRHYFCVPCYNEVRSENVEMEGMIYPKSKLERKKNDEETEEAVCIFHSTASEFQSVIFRYGIAGVLEFWES